MKTKPLSRIFTAALSLTLFAAWLVAANHCLVAGMLPAPQTAQSGHEHCPGNSAPAPEKKSGGCDGQNCCKSLSAPAVALAKHFVAADHLSFVVKDYCTADSSFLGEQHSAPIDEIDTGPPPGNSFAESVLQRSLPAHAPPLLS